MDRHQSSSSLCLSDGLSSFKEPIEMPTSELTGSNTGFSPLAQFRRVLKPQSHRMPGTNNMFPALHPTAAQQTAYGKTATQLLDATVQHYQVFNFHQKREMSRKRWKPVKSRDYLTVYKERDPQSAAGCDVSDDWKDPKLLVATGAIIGTLDDVMYGVVTPDAASMLLKASITKNRLIGGAVLNQIQGPTVHEPFRFLGVKWFVMAPPTTLNGMIWSRDLVFVEATGIKTLPSGERIGYQLMQSVDIPGYGHLESQSIMRGRISSCSVFRQLANGTVDVYVRGHVEAFGKVMDAVALKTAASGFLSSWNAVGCAQYKKLMWCVTHRNRRATSDVHNHRSCADCNKRFGAFASAGMCILCKQWLCSKCRVVSKLRDVDVELGLEEKDAIICNACVAHVDAQSTREIAKQEVRSGRFAPRRTKPVIKLWSFRRRSESRSRESVSLIPDLDQYEGYEDELHDPRDAGVRLRRAKSDGVQLFDPTQLYSESKSRGHSSDSSCDRATQSYEFYDSGATEDADESDQWAPEQVSLAKSYEKQEQSHDARQEQLWRQMRDLQAATEHIYQMTMQTTDAHLRRGAATP